MADPLHAGSHLGDFVTAQTGGRNRHGRRVAQIALLNAISTVLLTLAVSQGLVHWASAVVTLSYGWAGLLVFFILVRSGWSSARADPTMSFELLIFAMSVVVMSYGLIDIARGAALELLCLLLAFGMERLSTRQLLNASTFAIGMLVLTSLARITLGAATAAVHTEVYNLLMAAVLLPVAIIVGGEISRLHRRQVQVRSELASTLRRLTELSLHDGLTGLANRRLMLRLIEEARTESVASGQGYCLAMLDIDWFKRVNDRYGHAIGDAVLKDFAWLATAALESRWTMARWGGEEFLLLMPACSPDQARAAIAACRLDMDSHQWPVNADDMPITFSAGIASSRPDETSVDTLERADRCLYLAKANGRNRTEGFAEEGGQTGPRTAHLSQPAAGGFPRTAGPPDRSAPRHPARPDELRFVGKRRDDAPRGYEKPGDAPGPLAWLANTVLSTSPDIRENLRLPLVACGLHAVWMATVCFYAMPQGLIPAWAGWTFIGYESLSAGGFYAAIRCGWSRRSSDAGLVLMQMLAASAMVSFGYVNAPEMRPSILHMLCVIQVFGMVTLKPAEAMAAGRVAIAMLGVVILCLLGMGASDLDAEILKLLLAAAIVRQLSVLSRDYSTVRERVRSDGLKLQATVAQVQEQAMRDPLTGLLNRSFMEEALTARHGAWLDGGPVFCVGILDLDHFKRINDEKGHQVGDAVLIALALASRQSFRESDLLCRWGGDEFICLLPGRASEATSRAAMQRLRSAFSKTVAEVCGIDWKVTFSSGFASPRDDATTDELVAQADRALYGAKQGGRDCDVFANRAGGGLAIHPSRRLQPGKFT